MMEPSTLIIPDPLFAGHGLCIRSGGTPLIGEIGDTPRHPSLFCSK
jgi:hypothetical protein